MTPTHAEIRSFFKGMEHARKIAGRTKRGKVAALAISLEERTLKLLNEKHEAKK